MYARYFRLESLPLLGILSASLLLAAPALHFNDARAGEIIPAFGVTRTIDGGEDVKPFGSLSFRAPIVPLVATEIGVGYRTEERFDGALEMRMVPVTASLWLTPIPALYAGAGVGWYFVDYNFDQDVTTALVDDEMRQQFGVHAGGGVRVPLAPVASIDLNGRYVMMRDQEARLVPGEFNPDFWNTTLGLALKF